MADMDTDWLDGAVAASLSSTTNCGIMWHFNLGQRFETWADYKLPDNLRIDAAYMTDRRPVVLEQDGATWTIDFDMMTQVNDTTGTTRQKSANRGGLKLGDHGLSKVSTSWTTLRECMRRTLVGCTCLLKAT